MKREEYEEIMNNPKIKKYEWLMMNDIEGIYLKNGVSFHRDPEHKRYMYQDNKILVQHGSSKDYGDKLYGLSMISGDYMTITFKRDSFNFKFRPPQVGDTLVISENGKAVSSSLIMNMFGNMNGYHLVLASPIKVVRNIETSFFDTKIYMNNKENCMHNTLAAGTYKQYIPTESKKRYKDKPYHQVIKIKQIKRIEV